MTSQAYAADQNTALSLIIRSLEISSPRRTAQFHTGLITNKSDTPLAILATEIIIPLVSPGNLTCLHLGIDLGNAKAYLLPRYHSSRQFSTTRN